MNVYVPLLAFTFWVSNCQQEPLLLCGGAGVFSFQSLIDHYNWSIDVCPHCCHTHFSIRYMFSKAKCSCQIGPYTVISILLPHFKHMM